MAATPIDPTAKPSTWTSFWQALIRFQAEKLIPWIALRNTIGFALPLAAGVLLHSIPASIVCAIGALNVSFSDNQDPYYQRFRRMLAASLLVALAVFAGSLCGRYYLWSVAIAGVWAFAAGILVALGPDASDLGTVSLVTLVVFAANPQPPDTAAFSGLLALGGGLFQMVLSLSSWPFRRYAPERRALAELYLQLAQAAGSPGETSRAPFASAQSVQARSALATLHRDKSVEGQRYRLLLSQAERMRLAILTLARIHGRLRCENEGAEEAALLDRYFEICSRLLHAIGSALAAAKQVMAAPDSLTELRNLAETLRHRSGSTVPQVTYLILDARFQMDAITGQLRAAVDLESVATEEGINAFERRESARPWSLRLGGTVATLRANLSLNSAALRHAVRLGVCVAVGEAIARGFDLRRSYWVPMTIAIVLKPDFTATFTRGVLRLGGTFVGLIFATGLFHLLAPTPGVAVAFIATLMFVLRCFGPANYGILVAAVTAMVVLLIALTGVAPQEVMAARGLNTVAGGAIALFAYWLWPTWERTQVPEAMAQMLDAYRHYFRAIRTAYANSEHVVPGELDGTRSAARLARSNLEASVDRLSAEPGTAPGMVASLGGMLASSHRLIHAVMALEAGIASSNPAPPRPGFLPFANSVELTLYYLSSALRGFEFSRESLPDLREAHYALVQSGDSLTERYALVNVETDRITNSLNTLSEELKEYLKWSGREGRLSVRQPA